MRLVMLGPPGAGKGTQARLTSQHYSIPHISTGDILRAAVGDGSELGNRVRTFLDSGQLVPDEVVIDLIRDRLQKADCKVGYVLDGFPRTIDQARKLDELLTKIGVPLTHVLNLEVPEHVLLERIEKRGQSGSGRSDDNLEVAANRLKVFREQTAPVIEYYKRSPMGLKQVDGFGSIDDVQGRISVILDSNRSRG